MKLQKEYVHMNFERERKVTQITFDEDVIVPDSQPDMEALILEQGEIELDEVRPAQNRVTLKGRLTFCALYRAPSGDVKQMAGEVPFEEVVNVAETTDRDQWQVHWNMEDLTLGIVNSRKLSVRAIVTISLAAEQIRDAAVAVGVESEELHDVRMANYEWMQLAVRTRDTFRFREELDLEHNRPNVAQLLWKRLTLREFEVRPLDGALSIRGELAFFGVYAGEEEHIPLQYVEKMLPFSGTLDLPDCTEEMIPDVDVRLTKPVVEAKPDYDGEMRAIGAEALLELEIRLYEERRAAVLEDVYCPAWEVELEKQKMQAESLLIKNVSRAKLAEQTSVGESQRILQICHCGGIVGLDRVEPAEDSLVLEGAVMVQLLYLAADDAAPLQSLKRAVPFRHVVEVKGMGPETRCRVNCRIEQLSAVMLGGGDVEIKAVVAAEVLAFRGVSLEVIDALTVRPHDPARIEALPGMCGYIVQPGDTLWKIAKECCTTVDNIREVNGLTGDAIASGDRLLVIKQASQIIE